MQFNQSKTYFNLARSFAGESQAGMRYQMLAQLASDEEFKILSDTIRDIAKNETNHAKIFYNWILKYAGSTDNIDIEAGYPFHAGTLVEGLQYAAKDEESESKRIYPSFAEIAKEEGFNDIAASFSAISVIEGNHHIVFNYLATAVANGTLYKNDEPLLWICSECGYMHTSKEAWKICPVCKIGQGYVELHLPFDTKPQ